MSNRKILTYKNNLGQELEITNTAPLVLQSFTESESVNIYYNRGMNQDGNTYLGNNLDIKDLTLKITLLAQSKEELINLRQKVNKIFNPKNGEGYLVYKDGIQERKIKCLINKLPYFEEDKGNTFQNCLISLTANNPFWTGLFEIKEEIVLWKSTFMFPIEIPETGMMFGQRTESLVADIDNEGDVLCGMRIEFKALAPVDNPSLININNTSEFIKINKSMTTGEIINVNTYFGNKSVKSTIDDVTTNAFNYIDFGSTFMQLEVGNNLFKYDSDTNLDNLEVSIFYMPMYLGV